MKKLLIALLVIAASDAFAKNEKKIAATAVTTDTIAPAAVRSIGLLRSVGHDVISSFKRSSTERSFINVFGYQHPNDGGGGTFYWSDTSTVNDDGGMYIKPTAISGAGRWVRQYDIGQPVNVLWFGFVADGVFDNYPVWVKMIRYLVSQKIFIYPYDRSNGYYAKLPDIVFPQQNGYYYFSKTITIEYNMVIEGQATYGQNWGSKLLFPANITGIRITYPDEVTRGLGTSGVTIKDLYLKANVPASFPAYDTTAHGIDFKRPVFFSNVGVENFGGNGFNADVRKGGNTNLSVLDKCFSQQNLNGFHFVGIDAQAMTISSCNGTTNRAWNFLDRSFLGNTYTACHSATSGDVAGQKTYVLHRTRGMGKNYMYGALHDGFLKTPGEAKGWQDDWQLIGDSTTWYSANAAKYNASTYYWSGGSYGIDFDHASGENQYSLLIGCYSESGQMPGYLGRKSLVVGGDMGAGWRNNANELIGSDGKIGTERSTLFAGLQSVGIYAGLNKDWIRLLHGSAGIDIVYDTAYRTVIFKENNSGASSTMFSQYHTTPSVFGRKTIAPGALINLGGLYSTAFDDGLKARKIIYGSAVPASGTWSNGDLVINSLPASSSVFGWRCTTAGTPGTWEALSFGADLISGNNKQNGDGRKTIFTIPHKLAGIPSYWDAKAASNDAANIKYVTADAANIIIHYSAPPAAGAANLKWTWAARL